MVRLDDSPNDIIGTAMFVVINVTRGGFHETHRNLLLIVALSMYHRLTVLAMYFKVTMGFPL